MDNDIFFMSVALNLAEEACEKGEVPVGAVIVKNGEIISKACNRREQDSSAIAHAEILAIEEACKKLGRWRLDDCVLYVTLEPCPMCSGAIINSRISKVVFGARDALAGCCGSVIDFNSYPFNHSFEISGGVLEYKCKDILSRFFKSKRKN